MLGEVAFGVYRIAGFEDALALENQERTKRLVSPIPCFTGQTNGFPHPHFMFRSHGGYPTDRIERRRRLRWNW
jgi:hypothetical protein